MIGYKVLSVTPLTHENKPSRNPKNGPKADSTHTTYPEFSGKAVVSSAQIRASGMLQTKGRIMKPRIASRGPAALTASCKLAVPADYTPG